MAESKTKKKTTTTKRVKALDTQAGAKKSATKKRAGKKVAGEKATAVKSAAVKSAAKKTASVKSAGKKVAAKKVAAKKTAGKKTAGKKTSTKTAAKKTSAAKTTTKRATAKKAKTSASASSGAKAGNASKRTNVKGKALVVVESPAKARTIGKYLGSGFTVKASVGHVRDLPKSKIGVDVDNNFEPEYVVISDKKRVISDIRKAAENVEEVYLAPDPDREGEAIAWHIAEEIKDVNSNIKRILINEITKKGVTAAMGTPTVVNTNKTEAQQARRILDRLVGYEISPILWKKVRRGLSAGRVQSVAVRLLVEREQDIAAFQPEEYWSVECDCKAPDPPLFSARLARWDGQKAEPKSEAQAGEMAAELGAGPAHVAKVDRRERRRRPQPPFITSKLQQEAARKLRFTPKRTMALAQRLYEGLEVGDEGPVGLITYMRTDSTRVSDDALAELRGYIDKNYGRDYLPDKPNTYKTGKRAQDAHEAIRPTSTKYTPDAVAKALENHPEGKELSKLYTLIWQRFVAAQMMPAVYDQTSVDIERGRAILRATGQVLKFLGFTRVYTEQETDDAKAEAASQADRILPHLDQGMAITLLNIVPEQHFTQPPPRFSEASLVKELEERGIGRPSTYASILSTVVDRGYIEKKDGRLIPTELGTLVNELLVESFPNILNADFTAEMEADLDKVEEGARNWRELLGGFYEPFKGTVEHAKEHMRDVKREEIPTDYTCEKCASPMVIKWGRNGSFLACQGYPDCRNTKEIIRHPDGRIELVPEATTDEVCESCGAPMVIKRGRFGQFLACSRYPDCKTTKPISLGVDCPKDGCGGFLTEKRSRRGKPFYGCSNYAKKGCDFVTWDRPIPQPCPACGAPFLVKKETKRGVTLRCLSCDYKAAEGEENAA
ncbi:MAG: type I DNA topoisomerase [Proteobacteria bacterium]|nr:type I DNA topoisomerase [Pseudomonadota bacterium]